MPENIINGVAGPTHLVSVNPSPVYQLSANDRVMNVTPDTVISALGIANAPVPFNAKRLTNVANPTQAQDATTKNYTDTADTTNLNTAKSYADDTPATVGGFTSVLAYGGLSGTGHTQTQRKSNMAAWRNAWAAAQSAGHGRVVLPPQYEIEIDPVADLQTTAAGDHLAIGLLASGAGSPVYGPLTRPSKIYVYPDAPSVEQAVIYLDGYNTALDVDITAEFIGATNAGSAQDKLIFQRGNNSTDRSHKVRLNGVRTSGNHHIAFYSTSGDGRFDVTNCVLNGYENAIAFFGANINKTLWVEGGYYSSTLYHALYIHPTVNSHLGNLTIVSCGGDVSQTGYGIHWYGTANTPVPTFIEAVNVRILPGCKKGIYTRNPTRLINVDVLVPSGTGIFAEKDLTISGGNYAGANISVQAGKLTVGGGANFTAADYGAVVDGVDTQPTIFSLGGTVEAHIGGGTITCASQTGGGDSSKVAKTSAISLTGTAACYLDAVRITGSWYTAVSLGGNSPGVTLSMTSRTYVEALAPSLTGPNSIGIGVYAVPNVASVNFGGAVVTGKNYSVRGIETARVFRGDINLFRDPGTNGSSAAQDLRLPDVKGADLTASGGTLRVDLLSSTHVVTNTSGSISTIAAGGANDYSKLYSGQLIRLFMQGAALTNTGNIVPKSSGSAINGWASLIVDDAGNWTQL